MLYGKKIFNFLLFVPETIWEEILIVRLNLNRSLEILPRPARLFKYIMLANLTQLMA